MKQPISETIKLKKEDFVKKLQSAINEDKFLSRVQGWEKHLDAFLEFTYVDDNGKTITIIKHDS